MEHPDDAPLADEPQPGAVPNDQPATGEGANVGAPTGEPRVEQEDEESAYG